MRLFLALAVAFLLVQNAAPLALMLQGGLDYDAARHGEVVLLGTAGCPWCARVRAYLRAGGVPFRELDVEHDPEGARRFAELGAVAVPVVQVGGVSVRGYDPTAIREAFAQAAARTRSQ